jgi:hypothetical protein
MNILNNEHNEYTSVTSNGNSSPTVSLTVIHWEDEISKISSKLDIMAQMTGQHYDKSWGSCL